MKLIKKSLFFSVVGLLCLYSLFSLQSCKKDICSSPMVINIHFPLENSIQSDTIGISIEYIAGDSYQVLKQAQIKLTLAADKNMVFFTDSVLLGGANGFYNKNVVLSGITDSTELNLFTSVLNDCNTKLTQSISFTVKP